MSDTELEFDPTNFLGLKFEPQDSKVHLLPVPWEVTTSYGIGTANGPELIRQASAQLDFYDTEFGEAYLAGFYMYPTDTYWKAESERLKPMAQKIALGEGTKQQQDEINRVCAELEQWVYLKSKEILASNKILGIVGGDHSAPLGAVRALSEKYKGDFGVLHVDAHADLRNAYQGFKHSHASIMYNVMTSELPPARLVQVGIRDYCKEEYDYIQSNKNIRTFFDINIKQEMFKGKTWQTMCDEIIDCLPANVYVSFDIDGLSPEFCPNTGTPVPGGLSFDQALYLLNRLHAKGKKLIGFDLCEVSPGTSQESEWDGNVGARILFKLCGWSVTK